MAICEEPQKGYLFRYNLVITFKRLLISLCACLLSLEDLAFMQHFLMFQNSFFSPSLKSTIE